MPDKRWLPGALELAEVMREEKRERLDRPSTVGWLKRKLNHAKQNQSGTCRKSQPRTSLARFNR